MKSGKSDNQNTYGNVPLIFSVLGSGFVAGIIPAGLLPATVPYFEQVYSLSHDDMGRIVALCMIFGGGIGGLLGGWLCGRVGALRNMILAMAMAGGFLSLVGFTQGFYFSVLGLWGYFFSMGFMASSNALATVMLPQRQRGVGLLHALNATGKLAGPVLASLFLYGAWRSSYIAAAALPVLLIIPALMAGRNGGASVGIKHDSSRANLGFWISMGGFALIAGSEIAVALWLPTYGRDIRNFTPTQSNLLLSMFLAGLVVGRFAVSAFPNALSSRRAIILSGICVLFVVPALFASSFALAGPFFFLFGLGFAATWPSYFSHLSRVYPEHLGMMGGAAVLSTQLGFAFCSYTSGRLAEVSLFYPVIFGAAVMAVFVIAFFASPVSRKTGSEIKK